MTKAEPPCNACARGAHDHCVRMGCPCPDPTHPAPAPVDPEELPPPAPRRSSHWHDRLGAKEADATAVSEAVLGLLKAIRKELTPPS